jgi:DNA-binding transcriptional MerR regulator/effector-binding domain-containing protein
MKDRGFFTIGEFSKVTGLTVKALRFYHEQGLLSPTAIDDQTGYRYYDDRKIEAAKIVTELRRLDFSLVDVAEILRSCADDADLLDSLEKKRESIQARMRHDQEISNRLDQIIANEREVRKTMQHAPFEVHQKAPESILIAGVRMKAKYSECGRGFAQIGKRFGRQICGKAFLLHYDTEYREDDADFEACMPIRKGEPVDGISVRELTGGKCLALLHAGPYDELGRSYGRIFKHINANGYQFEMPTREVYLKGPGMIFKGNPKKYLTEIQVLVR